MATAAPPNLDHTGSRNSVEITRRLPELAIFPISTEAALALLKPLLETLKFTGAKEAFLETLKKESVLLNAARNNIDRLLLVWRDPDGSYVMGTVLRA